MNILYVPPLAVRSRLGSFAKMMGTVEPMQRIFCVTEGKREEAGVGLVGRGTMETVRPVTGIVEGAIILR